MGDIYIYIWYSPLRLTSEHFDILSLHVYIHIHIYYIYVHICIRVRSFFRCLVGSSCAHYQNKLETKNNI